MKAFVLLLPLCWGLRLQGTVRDFTSSYFTSTLTTTVGKSANKDPYKNYLLEVDGATDLFKTNASETFNTVPYSLEFTASSVSGQVEYASDAFYPIDGMLYGNEGGSNNKFFTFELETILDVQSTTSLTFAATCSMWIGTCNPSASPESCSTLKSWTVASSNSDNVLNSKSISLSTGVVRIWVAYVHHCQATPKIQIRLPDVNLYRRTCDVTTAPVFYPSLYPLDTVNPRNLLSTSAQNIYLLSESQTDIFTSAWHPTQLDIKRGFMTEFKIATSSNSPAGGNSYSGFAFVAQNKGPTASGDSGSRHFESITKGLAFEVHFKTTSQVDLKIEHRFDGASSYTAAATVTCSGATVTSANIYVSYDYESGVARLNYDNCRLQATLTKDSVFDMLSEYGYVGFTAGASDSDSFGLTISDWTFRALQVSGTYSKIVKAGVAWAQFGQHNGFGATSTTFSRITDVIETSYTDGTTLSIPTGTSFNAYDPFSTAVTNQLEVIYFTGETGTHQTVSCSTSDLTTSAVSATYNTGVTGIAKKLKPVSALPSTAQYLILAMDSCGNPVKNSASNGLASQANIRGSTEYTTNSTSFSCASGNIGIKYASYCGVDITSQARSNCGGSTSCSDFTSGVSCDSNANSWETGVRSIAYECYDNVAPRVFKETTSVGVSSTSFGFHQDLYGVYVQQRTTGNYSVNVRFNLDSIVEFQSIVSYDDVTHTTSSFTSIGNTLVAGNTYTMILQAKDQFGNNVTDPSVSFVVSFDQVSDSFTSTYLGGNLHNITVRLTGAISSMLMNVRVNSQDLPNSPVTIAVVHAVPTDANINMERSVTASNSSGVTANIFLEDAFNNAVTSGGIDVRAVVVGVNTYASTAFKATGFTGSQVTINNIGHTIDGAYTVEFYLNGTKLSDGGSPITLTVLPATESVAHFTFTDSGGAYSAGGISNYFDVQSRDQYGNQRLNRVSENFTLIFDSPSGDSIVIRCETTSVCDYTVQGAYRAYFSPTVAGLWTVQAIGSTNSSVVSFNVSAGAIDATQSQFAVLNSSIQAGATGTILITAKDAFGNLRSAVNTDYSSFVVTIEQISTTTSASKDAIAAGSNGVYTATWRATHNGCAGSYLITVRISGGNSLTNTTSRVVDVTPSATTQISDISGPGVGSTLPENSGTYFSFKARDQYNNLQLSSVTDTWDVVGENDTQSIAVSASGVPTYNVSYTTPAHDFFSPEFTLRIYLNNSSPGSLVRVVVPSTTDSDNSANGATATFTNNTIINPDVPKDVLVINRDLSGNIITTTGNPRKFDLVFFNTGGSIANVEVPSKSLDSGGNRTTITINPDANTKHLTTVGNYTMTIRVGTDNYSPNNYTVTVTTGTTSGVFSSFVLSSTDAIAAGESVTMTATVRDAYGNLDTQGGRNVVFDIELNSVVINTTAGVFDPASDTYKATYTPTVAGSYRFVFKEPIELVSRTLNVIAANASAITSSLGSLTSSTFSSKGFYIVDDTISAIITLRDAYNNLITGKAGNPPFNTTLTNNNDVVFSVTETSTSGEYRVSCTPKKSSLYNISNVASLLRYSVQISGQEVQSSPKSIAIRPGNVDKSQSSVTTIPTTNNAGEYMTINFTLKDANGNPWKQSIGGLTFSVTSPSTTYTSVVYGPSSNFRQPVPLGEGKFQFQVRVNEANGYLTYKLDYFSDVYQNYTGVNITGLQTRTYIFPGTAAADQTVVLKSTTTSNSSGTVGAPPFTAGFTAYTTIGLYDQYGNTYKGNATGPGAVTVRFDGHKINDYLTVSMPSAFLCGSSQASYTENFPTYEIASSDISSTVTCSNTTGVCQVETTGTAAGNFRMLVFVNGIGANCLRFSVAAGPVDSSGSTFTVGTFDNTDNRALCTALSEPIASQTVGTPNCITISMADAFGNKIETNTTQVVSIGNPTVSRNCGNSVANSTKFVISSSVYKGDGVYVVPFESRKTGTFDVVGTIGGSAVGSNSAASCKTVTYTPWYVYTFALVQSNISTIATLPSQFSISAKDFFNNTVTGGGHSFTVNFRLNGTYRSYTTTTNPSTEIGGVHVVDYKLEWPGSYRAEITLTSAPEYVGQPRPNIGAQTGTTYTISDATVIALTCAARGTGNVYCNDDFTGPCKDSYANCSGLTICSGTNVYCPSTSSCVANITGCPCQEAGLTRCKTGVCVANTTHCAENGLVCPIGYVNCASSGTAGYPQCVPTAAECPSPLVCPLGTFICDDGLSCASDTASCADYHNTSVCAPNQYRCHDGRCVVDVFDCPARKSCGSGMVVCSDGSCQTSVLQCPSQYKCFNGESRCADGSCVSGVENCPSEVTCPVGYVLCPNGKCATGMSECKSPNTCSASEVRCKDGSCAANYGHCPTAVTCSASAPILCDNGQCVNSHLECPLASGLRDCNVAFSKSSLVTCPDGSCAEAFVDCPTSPTCSSSMPVKCPDGSCQKNVTMCLSQTRAKCPSTFPITCPDGSCRSSLQQCPFNHKCPDSAPIKCQDQSCVSSKEACAVVSTLMECPGTQVRCPTLGCSPDLETCATLMTCPKINGTLFKRCVDGTCRPSCDSVSYSGCPVDRPVTCPSAVTGYPQCATTLKNCPKYYSCPTNLPVKCMDGTCTNNATLCAAWKSSYSKVPCADGGWQLSQSSCGTAVSCPLQAPYKCPDETCRVLSTDCLDMSSKCPEATPYRCRTGSCAADFESCQSSARCTNIAQYPVKCAAINDTAVNDGNSLRCTNDVEQCSFQPIGQCEVRFAASCPNRWDHCRDGSCVEETSTLCQDLSCESYLPYLCDSGVCVANSTVCPRSNGCPADRPHKCVDGSCVSRSSQCSVTTLSCTGGLSLCPDGSCRAPGTCGSDNGCAPGQIRCLDGSCVTYSSLSSSTSLINYCVSGRIQEDEFNNLCPWYQPYRCPGGLCAVSSEFCPRTTFDKSVSICPSVEAFVGLVTIDPNTGQPDESITYTDADYVFKKHPVMCADGSCVDSEVQCPTLHACREGYTRCGDGSCRLISTQCPSHNSCPSTKPYRCSNGMCMPSKDFCISPTSQTGCPCVPGGLDADSNCCTQEQVKCISDVLGGKCGLTSDECRSQESDYARANGCNTTHTFKCWNGACEKDFSFCLEVNGCPSSAPVRCQDGTCGVDSTACQGRTAAAGTEKCGDGMLFDASVAGQVSSNCGTYTDCPIGTPYRCADGSCAKYHTFEPSPFLTSEQRNQLRTDILPLACQPVLTCPNSSHVRCADYSCAAHADLCPPIFSCNSTAPFICPDLTCARNKTACSSTVPCPEESPIMCPNGACRKELSLCEGERIEPVCAEGEILCFDGACRASALDCIRVQYLNKHPASSTFNPAALDGDTQVCDNEGNTKLAVCSDGSCVPLLMKDSLCKPLPACPTSKPKRCSNSQCVAASATCPDAITCGDLSNTLAVDGICRADAAFIGGGFCPQTAPFKCSSPVPPCSQATLSSLCTVDEQTCNEASQIVTTQNARTVPTCIDDCNRDVRVETQTFDLQPNSDSTHVIAVSEIDLSVRAELYFPAGSIVPADGSNPVFQVEQVSDLELRSAINYIHRSRQGDFDGVPCNIFSMEQTTLSPAFKCSANQDPFSLKVQYTSRIDNSDLINPGTPNKTDICLAVINPASASWVCVAEYVTERNDQPITNTSETRFVGRGNAFFDSCKDKDGSQYIFAFAHIPKQASTSSGESKLIYLIQVIVVICVVVSLVMVLLIAWCTQRAGRYRKKMKKVQEDNKNLDELILDKKMYEGGLGAAGKDEDIDMVANPMVVKFKSLQEQMQEYQATTGYYQKERKKHSEQIGRLMDQKQKLQEAVKKLKLQLEEQRNRVQAQKKLREMRARQAETVNKEISEQRSPQSGETPFEMEDPVLDDDEDEDGDDLGREAI